jgi:hypothetical protein
MIAKILSIAASLVSPPALARTVTPECVWRHLPDAMREEVFAKYHAGGADGLGQAAIGDDQVIAAFRACSGRPDGEPPLELGPALVGAALRSAAAHELKAIDGVPTQALDTAWQHLAGAERQLLINAFRKPEADIPRETFIVLDEALRAAGLRTGLRSPRYRSYTDYFMGRAEEEAYSTRAGSSE